MNIRHCCLIGHTQNPTTHLCTSKECKLYSKWVCGDCIIQKIHNHGQPNYNHLMDQQQFLDFIKQQQQPMLIQKQEDIRLIKICIKELQKLVQQTYFLLERVQEDLAAIEKNYNIEEIEKIIDITKNNYHLQEKKQIEQIINIKKYNKSYDKNISQDLLKQVIQLNEEIQKIVDNNFKSQNILKKQEIDTQIIQSSAQIIDQYKSMEQDLLDDNNKGQILIQRNEEAFRWHDNDKQLNSQISDNSFKGQRDEENIPINDTSYQFKQDVIKIKIQKQNVHFHSIQMQELETQNQEYPFQEFIQTYGSEDFQRKLKQFINENEESKIHTQNIFNEDQISNNILSKIFFKEFRSYSENLLIENDIIFSAAICYDEKYLGFCSYSGSLQILAIKENICYQLKGNKSVTVCVFKPNSHSLISGSHDGWIFCFDGSNQFVIEYQNKIHNDAINCIKFVNKSIIITCSNDNNIIITDLENKQQQQKIANAHNHYFMSIDYNQKIEILVSCSLDRSIKIWSLSGKLIDTVSKAHQDFIMQIQIVESKRLLLSLCLKGQLKLWEFSQQVKIAFRSLIGSNDKIFYFYYVEESSNLLIACQNYLQIINFELRSVKIINHIANYVHGQIIRCPWTNNSSKPQNV